MAAFAYTTLGLLRSTAALGRRLFGLLAPEPSLRLAPVARPGPVTLAIHAVRAEHGGRR